MFERPKPYEYATEREYEDAVERWEDAVASDEGERQADQMCPICGLEDVDSTHVCWEEERALGDALPMQYQ